MRRNRTFAVTVAVLALLSLHASAFAAPVSVARDRSDNTHYFQYDGTLFPQESSVLRITRDDLVQFTAFVRLHSEKEPGERLVGRLRLQLSTKKKAVKYDGTFTLVVRDALGEEAYTASQEARFVLRPDGRHAYNLTFGPFDLMPGEYEAFARFTRTP